MTATSPTKDYLVKSLHPEWIQSRMASYGKKQYYIQGHQAMKLANTVFGRDGWKKEIKSTVMDFCEVSVDGLITVAMTATVRVTLRKSGTYHEDIGYGTGEHPTTKSVAMEKARFAAAFDGMKRALRKFGNVLGNCLYDTKYLQHVDLYVAPPPTFKPSTSQLGKQQTPLQQQQPTCDSSTNNNETRNKKQNTTTSTYHHEIKKEPMNTTIVKRQDQQQQSHYIKKEPINTTIMKRQKQQQQEPHYIKKEPLKGTQSPSTVIPSTAIQQQEPHYIKKEPLKGTQSPSTVIPSTAIQQPLPTISEKANTTTSTPQQLTSTVIPLSLMTRIKTDNIPISLSSSPPTSKSTSTKSSQNTTTLQSSSSSSVAVSLSASTSSLSSSSSSSSSSSAALVRQDTFPFDEQDEAWFIEIANVPTDPK